VRIGSHTSARTLHEVNRQPLTEARDYFLGLQLPGNKAQVAEKVLKEIVSRLQFLINVGLDYLSLDRSAETLSGGEAQRIRPGISDRLGADRRPVRARRAIDRPASA
jgi:excinuclease ABC subunit A